MLAQERLNSDQTTQLTRTPSCPESEVRSHKAGRTGSRVTGRFSSQNYGGGRRLCDGGVSRGTTVWGSGSSGGDVGRLGARVREAELFFTPGLQRRPRGGRLLPHARVPRATRLKTGERRAGPLSSSEDVAAELVQ